MDLYLALAYKNEEATTNSANLKIRKWLEATEATRKACEEALLALNQHRVEHGC